MKIQIVDYNPKWIDIYNFQVKEIKKALKGNLLSIHHFGSTSIPGLKAKPKIDILAVVKDLENLDNSALEQLDFEYRKEFKNIHSGKYFSKKKPKVHLHVFKKDDLNIEKNLRFRDWMRTHQDDRKLYENLKINLSKKYDKGMDYCLAKTDFINIILSKIENLIKNNKKKFESIKKLNLPKGEYAITGSGPLGIRNLKEINDIDIIVTSKLWDELVLKYGDVDQNNVKKIVILDSLIEIFYEDSFYNIPKEKDHLRVDQRIFESEIIEDLPFESLKNTLYYKYKMGREKDLKDINLIEAMQNYKKI